MNFTKTIMALAIGSVGVMGSMSAYAVPLGAGATLTITAGAQHTSQYGAADAFATGSWFAMDTASPVSNIAFGEQVLLNQSGPGTAGGLIVGSYSLPGDFHSGTAAPDQGPMISSWDFNSSTGTNYFNSALGGVVPAQGASLGGNLYEFSMSAWDVAWATTSTFNMGTGSWDVTNVGQVGMADINGATAGSGVYGNGKGIFNWDGNYGSTYTLDYTATVPSGGFAGTQYAVHLQGTVLAPVPEASTYGMMLAGLGLVGFAVRRRKLI